MQMYEQFLNHHGETKYKNLGKNEGKIHKMHTHRHMGVVAHVCNPSPQKPEAGGLLHI